MSAFSKKPKQLLQLGKDLGTAPKITGRANKHRTAIRKT